MKMDTEKPILTPFYEYLDSVVSLTQLQISNDKISNKLGRNSFQKMEISLTKESVNVLVQSNAHRCKSFDVRAVIRFYRSGNNGESASQLVMTDIFPRHLKIDVNGVSIPLPALLPYDRFRKDGRRHPRPVDITDALCDHQADRDEHECVIQWMADQCDERFFLVVHLVRRRSCEELALILMKKQMCPLQQSLNLIRHPDTSRSNGSYDNSHVSADGCLITSLTCPVSFIRMAIPVRGKDCRHLQCFDCVTYLVMNFHKPTWQCPICGRKALFLCLEVDRLILNVINDERSISLTKVAFNNVGQWRWSMDEMSNEDTNEGPYINMANTLKMKDEVSHVKANWHSMSEGSSVPMSMDVVIGESLDNADRESHITDISRPGTSVRGVSEHNNEQSETNSSISLDAGDDSADTMKSRLRKLLSSGTPKLTKLHLISQCRKMFKRNEGAEDIKEHGTLFNLSKRLGNIKEWNSVIVDGDPLVGKCELIEEEELFKNRERLLPWKCKECGKKKTGKVVRKLRQPKPGSRPVGRPRKDGMAPPPTKALKEITKARIKAKYLKKHLKT